MRFAGPDSEVCLQNYSSKPKPLLIKSLFITSKAKLFVTYPTDHGILYSVWGLGCGLDNLRLNPSRAKMLSPQNIHTGSGVDRAF